MYSPGLLNSNWIMQFLEKIREDQKLNNKSAGISSKTSVSANAKIL